MIAEDLELHKIFVKATNASRRAHTALLEYLDHRRSSHKRRSGPDAGTCEVCGQAWPCRLGRFVTAAKKAARQAARSVLPNATETRIVVTGNYRAWRHFIAMRAAELADVEIREVAVECLRWLQRVAPNVFADFEISTLGFDGPEIAASPYALQP